MNKKGFTIIELLGIIIIIGVIGIVSFNAIVGTVERNQVRQENVFSEQIINAASLYITANLDDFKELEYSSSNMYVDVSTLIEKGYLKKDIDNPTSTKTENYLIEVYKNSEGVLNYKLVTEKTLIYKDPILNGADPILEEAFIPVTIENNGTVKKADVGSEWYNYAEKKWANVVVVDSEKIESYKDVAVNTIINQNDISSYLVWIPRYKYKIPSSTITKDPEDYNPSIISNPTTIDIVFENISTAKSKGDAINTYYSHPAFTFGDEELSGIWVGKFETSVYDEFIPSILPNKTPCVDNDISEAFLASRLYSFFSEKTPEEIFESEGDFIDLVKNYSLPTKFDSHLMKNSEWGSVAYLSHSKYGINSEVRLNNNGQFVTGCGGTDEHPSIINTCQIPYGGASSYPQSTTGNITGIFDMAGGVYEVTMAYDKSKEKYLSDLRYPYILNTIDKKYYEKFDKITINSNDKMICDGKLCVGHAFNETNRWYDDYNNIVGYYIARGGYAASGMGGGLFSYKGFYSPDDYFGFRIAVTNTEVKK